MLDIFSLFVKSYSIYITIWPVFQFTNFNSVFLIFLTGDPAFSYEGRRIISMRNIPIAVSTDHLPPRGYHPSPHVKRPPHIHRPSYLNDDISGSVPNLNVRRLKEADKQHTTFSSIPMLNQI